MKRQITNLALAAAALFAASSLRADTISFDLTAGNSAINGFSGPYATVTVNRTDSTHATITFTSQVHSGNIFLMGGQGSVAVNVNAGSWSTSGFTGSNAGTGFTPGGWTDNGSNNEDGFGVFNLTVDSFDGYGHSSDTISFTLTDTDVGGSWANAASVLAANAGGSLAAAHIFVAASPASAGANGGNALATGYAANGGQVPDGGSTVALLGCGLAGIGMISRKFRKS